MATAKDPVLTKLAARIEYLRKQRGLSQDVLASRSGVHRAYFSDIESGRNISVKTANKIAKGLGIKLKDLFDF